MKEIKVTQSYVGHFNAINTSEKTFSFYMGIYEDNQVLEENGIKAILHYSGDPDDQDNFEDPIDNIEQVFDLCFKYSNKVWSSTDYKAQCLLFGKLYIQYFEELDNNLVEKRKIKLQKELEEIQKKLSYSTVLNDLTWQFNNTLNKQIKEDQKMVDYYIKEQLQLKEDSEKYLKNQEYMLNYQNKVLKLTNLIIKS
jgi:hypothetical protein